MSHRLMLDTRCEILDIIKAKSYRYEHTQPYVAKTISQKCIGVDFYTIGS